jgi:hypothetical protein
MGYDLLYFPLYIVAYSIVISTHKTKTLERNQAQVPVDFMEIEGPGKVEEELPPPPIAFLSPEDTWSHRAMRRSCMEELLPPLATEKFA